MIENCATTPTKTTLIFLKNIDKILRIKNDSDAKHCDSEEQIHIRFLGNKESRILEAYNPSQNYPQNK